MIVFSLARSTGEVICFGWGPADKPLAPLRRVEEGETLIKAVEAGELVLTNLLGTTVPGLDAARIVNLLSKKDGHGGKKVPVAVVRKGCRVKLYPSISAAARALGKSKPFLNLYIHRLPSGLAVYNGPTRKRVTRTATVAPVAPVVPGLPPR
jgi:hypothetical protein